MQGLINAQQCLVPSARQSLGNNGKEVRWGRGEGGRPGLHSPERPEGSAQLQLRASPCLRLCLTPTSRTAEGLAASPSTQHCSWKARQGGDLLLMKGRQLRVRGETWLGPGLPAKPLCSLQHSDLCGACKPAAPLSRVGCLASPVP